jgi:hypothetical protein
MRCWKEETMEIKIPLPHEVQNDLRAMISNLAREVIQDVKGKEAEAKPYMSAKEACAYLGVAFGTLQKFEALGLKKCRIEGKILFKKSTIDEFMNGFEE